MANKSKEKIVNAINDSEISNDDKLVSPSENLSKVPFSVVEAYKSIRTNIISILNDSGARVISISSANASEGKSTTSINIAISVSQLNKKVLLIDGDARKPTLHKKLKLDDTDGCMRILEGKSTLENAIQHYNPYLDILVSGPSSLNPSELFSSTEFDKLLENAKEKYDYVIVDTPPINVVSDSLILAQKCNGLILIIRAGITTHDAFKQALASVNVLNIKLLGTVINGSESGSKRYYKYKGYSYGYGYGYGQGNDNK